MMSAVDKLIRASMRALRLGITDAVRGLVDEAFDALAEQDWARYRELTKAIDEVLTVASTLKDMGLEPKDFVGPDGIDWAKILALGEGEAYSLIISRLSEATKE